MKKYKISIIIPVYNAQNDLEECLDSVLSQTLKDIEIICINDGSTDKSFDILSKYAQKDNRMSVINIPNSGPSVARNTGIRLAQGEYIQFVDADDWIVNNLCEVVYNNAQKNNSDLVIFNGAPFNNVKKTIRKTKFFNAARWSGHINENSQHTFRDYKGHIFSGNLQIWNKLYKREFLNNDQILFPEDIQGIEDYYFSIKAQVFANTITLIDKYLYNYRVNQSNSITPIFGRTSNIFQTFNLLQQVDEIFLEKGLGEIYKYALFEFKCQLLSHWLLKASWKLKYSFFKEMKQYFLNIDVKQYDFYVLMNLDSFYIYNDIISDNFLSYYYKLFRISQLKIKKYKISHGENCFE